MSGKRRAASSEKEELSSLTTRRPSLTAFLLGAMEVVLLALICLSPWAYGAIHPPFEFLLDAGIALLLALWAARILVEGQLTWKKSGVALCLAALFLLGVCQRTPVPRSILSWLSPGAERCYNELLPEKPEKLPDDTVQPSVEPPPGSTLSLYPGATRRESLRLLAVFLVFAVVYNNLTSKPALIRLSIVLLINGVLLSLFGLAQFFGAPRSTVYWHYHVFGSVFGPFINKDHFPDYVNMCIGLGMGLLVRQHLRGQSSTSPEEDSSLLQTLHNPVSLWICAALSLMVSAVAFSLSRGGILALVGAAMLCGVLGRLQLGRSFRIGSLLLIVGVVLALSAWLGIGLVKEKLATLGTSEAYEDRVPLWLRSLRIVRDFPVWGTGYGTFDYIEPMYREDAPSGEIKFRFEHAHNDYLEILVEGGVVGLCLAVAAFAFVFRCGYLGLARRSHAQREGKSFAEAGLALGLLFAFSALVMHSFVDFGARIPAITLLATVVAAHLCALGPARSPRNRSEPEDSADVYRLRLGGIIPILGASVAVTFGLVICASGWKAHRVYRLEDAAYRTGSADAAQVRQRVAYLSAAASMASDNAPLHVELGRAHAKWAELLILGNPDPRAILKQSILSLQEFLHARDACPLESGAQLGIAAFASRLKQGDSVEAYLSRAKLLSPGKAETWYRCGLQEFILGHFEDAWATWRHCLELSNSYLPQIVTRARRLKLEQLVEKVLPDNPDQLLDAAMLLYPDSAAAEQRSPFMDKALRILESKPEGMIPRDRIVNIRAFNGRLGFARYLYKRGKFAEARRELMLVLAQSPDNQTAKELLSEIARQKR